MTASGDDWVGRVRQRLRERGFTDAVAFGDAHPTAPFRELARLLGDDVLAVHVEWVMKEDARLRSASEFDRVARSGLVRFLHEDVPSGWGSTGPHPKWVLPDWLGMMGNAFGLEASQAWFRLKALPPPPGWLPTGPDDPILLQAFRDITFPTARIPASVARQHAELFHNRRPNTALIWRGDWAGRVRQRVREKGFPDANAFGEAFPVASFLTLADMLGEDVAAAQLETVMKGDASLALTFDRFARSALVRHLHEYLPDGWGSDDMGRASAYAHWGGSLEDTFDPERDAAWDRLEALPPPPGWLPAGPDDPILLEAFRGITFPTDRISNNP
jgi:hypothetical protein